MTVVRVLPLAAAALLTSVTLTGCGGSGDRPSDAGTPYASTSAEPTTGYDEPLPVPSNVKLEKPKARSTIAPSATLTAVPGASQMPAPAEAPRTIQGFPVPPGSKVKDPGAIDETWQFDISTRHPNEVLAFYRRVLPQMGYRVRTDVTYTVGYEEVHWDIAFDGPVSGTMAVDRVHHTVFVVVNPPGQPAFAGDR